MNQIAPPVAATRRAGPRIMPRFRDLAGDRELLLVDVWGVLHNGLAAHPAAGDALTRFRAAGGFVVLISNAPRPSEVVVGMLDRLGVLRTAYDGVVTSGDVTRALLAEDRSKPIYHLGPPRDRPIFEGLGIAEASVQEAARIVCSGLDDDETETAESYRPFLEAMLARGQPLICANPDLVVERGAKLIPCAGALAELYESLGGTVVWAGKPHAAIYEAAIAFAAAGADRVTPRSRMLAIGDALRTDVAGAAAQGIEALLCADGIHAKELLAGRDEIDEIGLARLIAEAGVAPLAVTPRLAW
jgi:HAD superfamily hydrolase (TIGR01459 family)